MEKCSIDVNWSFQFDSSKVVLITESDELSEDGVVIHGTHTVEEMVTLTLLKECIGSYDILDYDKCLSEVKELLASESDKIPTYVYCGITISNDNFAMSSTCIINRNVIWGSPHLNLIFLCKNNSNNIHRDLSITAEDVKVLVDLFLKTHKRIEDEQQLNATIITELNESLDNIAGAELKEENILMG